MANTYDPQAHMKALLRGMTGPSSGAAGIAAAGGYQPGPEDEERRRKRLLAEQAAKAGGFADFGESGYGQLGADARARMDYLRQVASGQHSIAGEQLRQGTQALQAQQRSMAAAAAPRDAASAAHAAMLNSARLGYGMSGQAALAGLQERRDAEAALAGLTTGLRGQDLQAALGGRQTAIGGYGAGTMGPAEKSWLEKYGPMIVGGLAAAGGKKPA
jgi:hypothetical protein